MASPRPLPDARASPTFVPRKKRSNTSGSSAAGMPGPESRTSRRPPSGVSASATTISPPRLVNLRRVADQVAEQLHDPFAVEAEHHRAGRHLARQGDAAPLGQLGVRLDHRPHRVAQVAPSHVQREDAGIDARQVEQVGAHPLQSADLLGRAVQELAALRLVHLPVALELGEGAQRGDGRAQLVADIGDELAQPIPVRLQQADRFAQPIRHDVELLPELVDLDDPEARRPLVELALRQAARRPTQASQRRRSAGAPPAHPRSATRPGPPSPAPRQGAADALRGWPADWCRARRH